jgi:hypothetical protein
MRYFILLLLTMLLITWACNESKVSVFSVIVNDIKNEKTDSIIVNVETNGALLELKGDIDLIEGECVLVLRTPDQDTIYHKVFQAPVKTKLNNDFRRETGDWVFIYSIKKENNVQPSGSLNLQIIYQD